MLVLGRRPKEEIWIYFPGNDDMSNPDLKLSYTPNDGNRRLTGQIKLYFNTYATVKIYRREIAENMIAEDNLRKAVDEQSAAITHNASNESQRASQSVESGSNEGRLAD